MGSVGRWGCQKELKKSRDIVKSVPMMYVACDIGGGQRQRRKWSEEVSVVVTEKRKTFEKWLQ